MMNYDVSIIIVNWNTRDILRDCLRSVYEQTEDILFEVIVVDNASTDGSPEVVASNFPEVNLIRNETNLGFSAGNNIGTGSSSGRYVCLINSDVIVLDHCIEKLVSFMDQHEDIGMAGPWLYRPDMSFHTSCKRLPKLSKKLFRAIGLHEIFPNSKWFPASHMTRQEHSGVRDVDILIGCFWMIRREALDKVGGLDERFFMYCEDNDWCKRFKEAGWRVVYYPEATAIHAARASSSNEPIRFMIERDKSEMLYWRKHRGLFGLISCILILFLHYVLRVLLHSLTYCIKPSQRETTGLRVKKSAGFLLWLFRLKKEN